MSAPAVPSTEEQQRAQRCLAQGIDLGNKLTDINVAIMNKDEEGLAGATQAFLEALGPAECITPDDKDKVLNEAQALFNFASSRDKEGVRQAYDLLRQDVGFPELVETPTAEVRAAGGSGFRKYRTVKLKEPSGYRLTVDGREEIKFVPKVVAAETFQAQVKAHPTRRIELVPVMEAPVSLSRPAVPTSSGRPIVLEEPRQEAPSREGYIERIRDESGKVSQIKYFDGKGNLIQTIDKGNFESLE